MFQLQFELGSTSIYYEQYYPHLNVTKINIKKRKKNHPYNMIILVLYICQVYNLKTINNYILVVPNLTHTYSHLLSWGLYHFNSN
jgi:hypothetical protein